MPRRRTEVTYKDAERYVKLIQARWGEDVFDMYGDPRIVENWDGRGNIGICWDGPYEWTYYSTIGSFKYNEREPEFGIALPIVAVPASLGHVFSEPYNASVLMLYLD